jgi:hypothetical protein
MAPRVTWEGPPALRSAEDVRVASQLHAWSGQGPVPRRVFKTREPVLAGWKVRLLRRSVFDRRRAASAGGTRS